MNKILAKIKKYWIFIIIILFILIDQITKNMIIKIIEKKSILIISEFIKLELVKNSGGAFGIGEGNITMFIITNFIVLGVIIRFLITQKDQMDQKTKIVLSIILAGGFSNLIDRILRGYVVDYVKIGEFPVFNIADCLIVIGWISFCLITAKYTWGEIKKRKEE